MNHKDMSIDHKIKVMHVLCMPTYSGAENVAITLINGIKENCLSFYVSPNGPIKDIVEQNNIKHFAIKRVSIKEIKKAIKAIKPDIIHAHDFTAGVICAFAAGKIPVINHLHNNSPWLKTKSFKTLLYAVACKKFSRILTVSDSVMNEFIFGKKFLEKTTVIGNPINIEKIRALAEVAELKDDFDIVFLGRLSPPKNPLMFLDIIKGVSQELPTIKAVMVGEGELRSAIETKIKELGIENNVHLYGFQKNPYGLVNNSKIMCMPSLWEGFGLAAVEGLALGKPVVASSVGGLVNIVDESCGMLCTNLEEYVKTIITLLLDNNKYIRCSEGALLKAKQFDNLAKYSKMVVEIYHDVLDERGTE